MLPILVAHENALIRRAVRTIIANHEGWELCGEAVDGEDALALALREMPGIAIVDVALPRLNGIGLTRRLRHELPRVRVLLFSKPDTIASGFAAGARGYVLDSDSALELEEAIEALGANRPYLSPAATETLLRLALEGEQAPAITRFTPRELQITQLVVDGYTNRIIARRLNISVKTVECHRSAVMRKAGCHSAAELVRFAMRHKLVSP